MGFPRGNILASGLNPFDKAYNYLQHEFDKEIIRLLSDTLDLNITLIDTPLITNLTEYEEDPDTWILEQIANGTAEMSSTSLLLTPDSPSLVQYSFGVGTFRPQLYYRAKTLREGSNIYLVPFSIQLWICLIIAIVLLTLTLTFILSKEAKLPHEISYDVFARIIDIQQDRDEDWSNGLQATTQESLLQKEKWEMGEILLVCLGALCQQGSARDPSLNAARLLLLVLFVLAVVGYTAYSASIISLISLFPSTEREESGHVENFSCEYKTLLHSTNKITRRTELGFNEVEFTNLKKGFEETIKGEAVYLGDRDVSLTFLHRQNFNSSVRCTLGRTFVGMEHHRVFAVKNDSIYRERINYNILRLKQFGLLQRQKKRIFNIKSPCTQRERSSRSNFVSFDNKDVNPVVNLFKLGLISSFLLLIVEIFFYYCPKGIQKICKISSKKSETKRSSNELNKNFKSRILFLQKKTTRKNAGNKKTNNIKDEFSKAPTKQQFLH